VINAQLNAFLTETRRTIARIDMMVLTNLVEDIICRYFCLKIFFSNAIPFIEVINVQLTINAFLTETRRTIAGIDRMVLTNLVEDVICRYVRRIFSNLIPFKR